MNVTFALASLLFASSGAELPLPIKVPGVARDTLIVLIAAAAVGLVLLGVLTLWVKTRRSRRHHHHHRHHQRSEPQRSEPQRSEPPTPESTPPAPGLAGSVEEADAESATLRHRRRKRRREHRPRNPTLAETGGLPPPRPQGQVPPGL